MDLEQSLQLLQELTRRQREQIHQFLKDQFLEPQDWDWQNVPQEPTLTDVFHCAVEVLGDPATALDWLTASNEEFNAEPPILHQDRLEVIRELGRIEHGVF